MKRELGILKGIVLFFMVSYIFGCTTPEERAKILGEANVSRTHAVIIQQMKFVPEELTLNEGDSVTWINKDIVDHNVTEETKREWASPNLPSGQSWSTVVTKSASYFCTIHPVMKGSLNVK